MESISSTLDVNTAPLAEANGQNGSGDSNGAGAPRHLARNAHSTLCGLDRSFHCGAVVTSRVTETTCKNCRRAHDTITLIRQRARKWEQEHGPRPAIVPRPVNGERDGLVQMRLAFEQAEQMRDRILENQRLNAIEEAYFGDGAEIYRGNEDLTYNAKTIAPDGKHRH
jgi:hypothetical protein